MIRQYLKKVVFRFGTVFLLLPGLASSAQEIPEQQHRSDFWSKVQFGGGLGLGFGSGYTNVALAPSAIYNLNQYVALGAGLQYSYLDQRDFYRSHLYGASVIGLFNPIAEVQLSAEVEQLRASVRADNTFYNGVSDDFWNTGLFLGAGYQVENVTIGLRYNVLFQEDKGVYGDALMPFIRAYF